MAASMSKEFIGLLRERITIERPVNLRNPMGLQQAGWEPVCRCLAAIAPDSVGPESEAQALSARQRFRVTIRWREGVALDQRILWADRTLMIRQLINDPRERERITMRCEEVRR